ncbi:hypothetical protein F4678DRAFT_26618 [Xylaria arbuscula]|nr:hypothetical protein F4678DRAFT_26618 [Xylaria arbuscula]
MFCIMWWTVCLAVLKIISITLTLLWCSSSLRRLSAYLCRQAYSKLQQLVRETLAEVKSALKRRYVEFLQRQLTQLDAKQEVECKKCVELQELIRLLESRLEELRANNREFDTNTNRALRAENVELERELSRAKQELQRTLGFLHAAESQANERRARIRLLKAQLESTRNETNHITDLRRNYELQIDLEELQHENAQLKTKNLQQWNNAMWEKQRAERAERERDFRDGKIRNLASTLATKHKKFEEELGDVRSQLRHQTRRADAQQEAQMRLEAENEELRRRRTATRRRHHTHT